MGEFIPEHPKTYISDWGPNNLYAWAMSQVLPYAKFDWVGSEEWQHIDWQQLPDNDNDNPSNARSPIGLDFTHRSRLLTLNGKIT